MTVVKEISATLKALVERFADAVGDTSELVEEIKKQAAEEHLSANELRELIESALKKKGLSDRTIRNNLPDFTKDAKRAAGGRKGNEKRAATIATPKQSEKTTNLPKSNLEIPTIELKPHHGDAGNNPELIKQYTPQTFKITRKTLNQLNEIATERRALNHFELVLAGDFLEVSA